MVAHNSSQYCLQAANKNHGTPHSTPSPLTHSLLLVNVQHLNLRGVPVSHSHQCLLDIEFVDDIVVYMQGDMENRKKLESGLSLFSERSNTMINWHKSCAIWLSHALRPHPNFMLINQGVSTRYLGFQIGFNIAHETMIAPIIHSIQQKSIHWSSKKLSLRGHIIGANQVLLATTWYNI